MRATRRNRSSGEVHPPRRHPNPIPREEQAEVRQRIIDSEPEGFLTQKELHDLFRSYGFTP